MAKSTKCKNNPALFLLTVVGVIIGFLLAFTAHNLFTRPCTTKSCVIAASDMIKTIDPSANPCENFYKFACGGLIKRAYQDERVSHLKYIKDDVNRQFMQILKEPIDASEHYMVKNAKLFFATCTNQSSDNLDEFKGLLEKVGGWPVVKSYHWDEERFDWKDTVYRMRELGLNPDTFFKLEVEEDPDNVTKYLVFIDIPNVPKLTQNDKIKYKEVMIEVAMNFGAEHYRASAEMDKTLSFLEELYKITENDSEGDDDMKSLASRRYNISDYQSKYDYIDWLEYINNILSPVSKLKSDDIVVFPKDSYTAALFKLLNKTQKRTIANYMFWNLIIENLNYLPKEISESFQKFKCETKKYIEKEPRVNICKRLLSTSFATNPLGVIYARRFLPKEKKEHVEKIVKNIRGEIVQLLKMVPWMDEKTKEASIEKSQKIHECIGAPGDYFNDEIFNELGKNMKEFKNETFLSMSLKLNQHKMTTMYDRLNKKFRDILRQKYYNYITVVNALYSQDNTMIIPAGVLQGTFFDHDRPEYLNYGALGTAIAHELTHAFGKEGGQFNSNGEHVPIWTNKTLEAYEIVSQCVVEEAENFDLEGTEKNINGTGTLEENVADYSALKLSYRAYKSWVNKHGEEAKLPGLDYSPYQLFWVSTVAYQCYHLETESLEKLIKIDPHAHPSFRAFGPMRNNIDFAEDFNCPEGSKMNPTKRCQVF